MDLEKLREVYNQYVEKMNKLGRVVAYSFEECKLITRGLGSDFDCSLYDTTEYFKDDGKHYGRVNLVINDKKRRTTYTLIPGIFTIKTFDNKNELTKEVTFSFADAGSDGCYSPNIIEYEDGIFGTTVNTIYPRVRTTNIPPSKNEIMAIYNKIMKVGVESFLSSEIFELTEEEKREASILDEEKKEIELPLVTPNEEVKLEKIEDTPLKNVASDEAKFNLYSQLVENDIPLSEEQQKEFDDIKRKMEKMQRLETYRENAEERRQHQQAEMDKRREQNEVKNEEWVRSKQASSLKREQEIEQLKKMRKHVELLEQLKALSPDIITDEQNILLGLSKTYLEADELAQAHQKEEGMNPQIREMLAKYYDEQEKSGKSR